MGVVLVLVSQGDARPVWYVTAQLGVHIWILGSRINESMYQCIMVHEARCTICDREKGKGRMICFRRPFLSLKLNLSHSFGSWQCRVTCDVFERDRRRWLLSGNSRNIWDGVLSRGWEGDS